MSRRKHNPESSNGPAGSAQPVVKPEAERSAHASGQVEDAREGQAAEERHHRIAVAAYYRAERRGFAPGCEMDDWFEAEAEIRQDPASHNR